MKRLAAVLTLICAALAQGQVIAPTQLQYTWKTTATTSGAGQLGSYLIFSNLNVPRPSNYNVSWTASGTTASACTFNAQGSNDNVTWTNLDGASPVSCVASGNEFITGSPVLYFRIHLATFTVGDSTTVLTFTFVGANTGGVNPITLINGSRATTQAASDKSTLVATDQFAHSLAIFSCQPGIGDGLNAIAAGTYPQTTCSNDTGLTVTLTRVACFTDNAGSSTMTAANGAGTALLIGAVTCGNTKNPLGTAGTQSATVTIAAHDSISFTFVADGTSKQATFAVAGTF